jgi:hypothetical protein
MIRLPRLRFSLRTLVIFVLLCGSGFGLWYKWEPWYLDSKASAEISAMPPLWLLAHDERPLAPDDVRLTDGFDRAIRDRQGRLLFQFKKDSERFTFPLGFLNDDTVVFSGVGDDLRTFFVYHRRRPEWWWGVAWLPEFWATLVFAGAFGWSAWRDRRTMHA